MKTKPGEVYDVKGLPIYPGDVLRSFHFTAARYGKKYYLYHTAVWNSEKESMEMVPAHHLEPTKNGDGGRCWLTQQIVDCGRTEIVEGIIVGDAMLHDERPKRPKVQND